MEGCIGQGTWKEYRTSVPSQRAPLSPNPYVFPNPEAPRTMSFWVFMEASLHKHN